MYCISYRVWDLYRAFRLKTQSDNALAQTPSKPGAAVLGMRIIHCKLQEDPGKQRQVRTIGSYNLFVVSRVVIQAFARFGSVLE